MENNRNQNMAGGVQRTDISILRIIASLAVVMIHTCNTITNNLETFNPTSYQYKILVTINSLSNWSVPMFFMITGVLLLRRDKVIEYKDCICKYAKRILLSLFIFGVPFAWLEIFAETKVVSLDYVLDGVARVISGNSWGHLWYLYELIGVYLVLPIIKAFTDRATQKEMRTALTILFLFNLFIQTLNGINPVIGFYLPIRTSAIFYLMLGRYLDEEIPYTIYKYKHILLVAAMIALIVISLVAPNNASVVLGYSSPVTALLTVAIFCSLRGCRFRNIEILWKTDRLCFSVYLCHPVFTNLVYKLFRVTPLMFGNLIIFGIVSFWAIFVICGFIIAKMLNLIPVLRKNVL